MTILKKILPFIIGGLIIVIGCAGVMLNNKTPVNNTNTDKTYTSSADNENAILADNESLNLADVDVTKTGNGENEEADFYGTNAAVLAQNGASLTINNSNIETNGKFANGVFFYGEGTTVNISDSSIKTKDDNSGGIMTTGGAAMNAENLEIETNGNSSAAIRSDRGWGTVTVNKGTYTTNGKGSPAIYSTADISVTNASINANDSEAVVIEGGNSVTFKNVNASGNNKSLNGQSEVNTNVMIYQSMSGDASEGKSSFTMTEGEMTSKTGTMFYVTNTTTEINLSDVDFENADDDFLIVAAGPWGNEGSNGGNVTLNAKDQDIDGKITVDEDSTLNLILSEESEFEGQITSEGETYVELGSGCTWKLTGNSSISGLTCDNGAIELNRYTLTVDGKEYTSGASKGTAIKQEVSSTKTNGNKPDGEPSEMNGQKPEGEPPTGEKPQGEPPEKPNTENN